MTCNLSEGAETKVLYCIVEDHMRLEEGGNEIQKVTVRSLALIKDFEYCSYCDDEEDL